MLDERSELDLLNIFLLISVNRSFSSSQWMRSSSRSRRAEILCSSFC
uniref:Uncharacterized protein n=1 Tax=Ciona intestinalis TaxID=7719 RepID=H2XZ39_CIOIN